MNNKFVLGPLQTAWIEALKSGNYKKGKDRLRTGDTFCCLGVACEVLKIPSILSTISNNVYIYNNCSSYLPSEAMDKLKMKTDRGEFINSCDGIVGSLAMINDSVGSFEPVIEAIEQNADQLFHESA